MRRLLKIVLYTLIAVLILIVLAVILLTTAPGEKFVRGVLEDRLSTEVGLPVKIAGFETNLWSRVQIDTLTVSSSAEAKAQPLLYVGHVQVDYSIFQLLSRDIRLKEISIDSVALNVQLDSLGRFGVPLLDRPASTSAEPVEKTGAIYIDTISLSRTGVTFLDPNLPLSVELAGVVFSSRGTAAGAFTGRLNVEDLSAAYDSLALNFNNFEIAASLDAEKLHIDYAKAECAGLHLEASGDLAIGDPQAIALTASVQGPLDSLAPVIVRAFDLPSVRAGYMSTIFNIDGSLENPTIKVNTEINNAAVENLVIDSIGIQAQYHDDLITLDRFRISSLGGTIRGNAVTTLDSIGSTSLNLTLEGIDLSSLWTIVYNEASPYQGFLDGKISAQGQNNDILSWAVEANIFGRNLRYLNRSISRLECAARMKHGKTDFSFFHENDTIHAEVEFEGDSLRGAFDVSVPDLTALARFFDQPELRGRVSARGTIDGHYTNPSLQAAIYGSKIAYRNFPVDSIFAELSYADSVLRVIDAVIEGAMDSVNSQSPPFELDSVAGSLTYACRLSGTMENLSGNFHASIDKPQYGSFAIDSLSLQALLTGSQIEISELTMSRGELAARLQAAYDTLTASGSFDLMLHRLSIEPDTVAESPADTIELRKDFGSITGNFAVGANSKLDAAIQGKGLWLGLLSVLTDDTTISDGEVDFDLDLNGPFTTPDADFRANLRSLNISGYHIDSITTRLNVMDNVLTLDSLILGALGHILRASGRIELGISPDGYYELRDSAPVALELSTSGFDLSAIEGILIPDGELSGMVSAVLNVRGVVAAPRFEGWLSAENGRVLFQEGSEPVENIEMTLRFADSVMTIEKATATVSGMGIEAAGFLATSTFTSASVNLDVGVGKFGKLAVTGLVSETSINLDLTSDSLGLTVLEPFMTGVDSIGGNLSCRILVAGEPAEPQIDGSLKINSLGLQSRKNNINVSNGFAAVRFDKNRVLIDSVLAAFNGGNLALSGTVTHDHGELLDIGLSLHANGITMQEPETYIIKVDSARLSYGKQNENYVLEGDIILGQARLLAGFRPTSILPWVQSLETVDLELPELIARSRLDIRIRASDQVWVDNNLAKIRLRTELGIIGSPLRPNFTGLVKVEEGYLIYLDRHFHISEGVVYFNDPARFNPDINLNADTRVTVYRRTTPQTYSITIRAEGLLDQLQYGLESDPVLDKSDIVALLTLGATRSELVGSGETESQSGLTGVLKDRAAMLTSQRISNYISRKAGSIFGFEEFSIQGNLFKFNEGSGPQLVATKRLTRRAQLTYSTAVGHLNDQTVRLGYRLTSRFSLQGETDHLGRAGIDIKYGLTFK